MMSRGAKHQNDLEVFNLLMDQPELPKPRRRIRSTRLVSVRVPSAAKGKLTTAERLKLAKAHNGYRLTQSVSRQKREREKAEKASACQKILIRRKEDPNLVWDLTNDTSLSSKQASQPAQPDELVSEDDEDEEDFADRSPVRKLFTSPERVTQLSPESKRRLRDANDHVTEVSDEENVSHSRLKKRRITMPSKRIALPITSSVFAPDVRSAISNNTTQQHQRAIPKQRKPLRTIRVNGFQSSSQRVSKIARSLHDEAVQRARRRRQSEVTNSSGEMVLNISTITSYKDDVNEVHEISDDDCVYYRDSAKPRGSTSRTAVPKKTSWEALKRPRPERQADRSIPAKSFYGKNSTSKSKSQQKRDRIVIPLVKGQLGEVPCREIAQLSLQKQQANPYRGLRQGLTGGPTRKIQYESTDEDEEAVRSEIDIRFKPLSSPELEVVRSLTFKVSKNKVMAKIAEANIELKAGDFSGLRGSRWLNDEILNSFVALINARNRAQVGVSSKENTTQNDVKNEEDDEIMEVAVNSAKPMEVFRRPRPRAHIFNTFFFPRLSQHGYDYNGVRRWLKRAGRNIKELDLIMFPINLSNFHWVLAAIDMRGKQLLYFDSTYGEDASDTISLLRKWLQDEVADKHGERAAADMQIDKWGSIVNPSYLPKQKDGGSCGIFTLYMAEYLERGRRPNFTQDDICTLRQRTALFLKRGNLPDS